MLSCRIQSALSTRLNTQWLYCPSSNIFPARLTQRHRLAANARSFSRVVNTLDPSLIKQNVQQTLDLSGACRHAMLGVSPANSRVAMSYAFQLSWQDTKTTELPFPDSTCGFFYFHPAPNGRPRISGEVRFRMARNPTEFDAGEDLKIPSGEVWSRPVYSLAAHRNLRPLYAKLVEEGLVAPDLHDAIKARVEGKRRRLMYTRCTILYTLQDPFIFDLSSPTKSFWALTENDLAVGELQKIFTDTRDTYGTFNPYAGCIRARFEPSCLPEHQGTRTVVLRVLDILEPIRKVDENYDSRVPVPGAGSLVFRTHQQRGSKPWSLCLDKQRVGAAGQRSLSHALQVLWDEDKKSCRPSDESRELNP